MIFSNAAHPNAARPLAGPPPGGPIVEASGLVRDYPSGESVVHALRGIDLVVGRGQLVVTAIVATHDPMMLDVADRVVELVDEVLHEGARTA